MGDIDSDDMVHDGFENTDSYNDSDSEDGMFDFGGVNPYGIAMGDMSDGMFNEVYNNCGTMGFGGDIDNYVSHQLVDDYMDDPFGRLDTSSSNSTNDEDGHDIQSSGQKKFPIGLLQTEPKELKKPTRLKSKRHLAILRTNRQIYNEASGLLHSNLTVNVTAPSKDVSFTNTKGHTIYKSLPLDGAVEPHVFARFEKISYVAEFIFECNDAAPSFHVNDDSSINDEDAAKFISFLTTARDTTQWFEDPIPGRSFDNGRRDTLQDVADITISSVSVTHPSTADIIQNFVDLLSNSPLIRRLEFILDVSVRCKNVSDNLSSDSDDESDSQKEAEENEKMDFADERATELFLESGVLDSLRKLSNVKCFSLEIETMCGYGFMELKQRHLNMVEDLKRAIENNWVVKHGPR